MLHSLAASIRVRPLASAVLAVLTLISLSSIAAVAANGDLDPSFGAGGKLVFDRAGLSTSAHAVAVQSDGKIVLVAHSDQATGPFIATRLHPDGAIDTTFGVNGWAMPGRCEDMSGPTPTVVAVQPDGKIVVVGAAQGRSENDDDFGLVRLNSNGTVDTRFGIDGCTLTDFAFDHHVDTSDIPWAVIVQDDNSIIVAGQTDSQSMGRDFALARYRPNGDLDRSFGDRGLVRTSFTNSSLGDVARAVSLQSDGRIVAVGEAGGDFAAARYLQNGSLDPTFGAGGKTTVDASGLAHSSASAVAIQMDGRIVVAGGVRAQDPTDAVFIRLQADGVQDLSFGIGGVVTTNVSVVRAVLGLALQADGRIVVAGSDALGIDFLVTRYNRNGALDLTFGNAGVSTVDFDNGMDRLIGVGIQPSGGIVVAGSTKAGDGFPNNIAVARLDGSAAHDLKFFPNTAGALTSQSPAPGQMVALASGTSWVSDPLMNGRFLRGAQFQVKLECVNFVGAAKRVRLSTTNAEQTDEQVLGEVTVGRQLCSTQTLVIPVTTPTGLSMRRLKLTLAPTASAETPVNLGAQVFVRATDFVGVP